MYFEIFRKEILNIKYILVIFRIEIFCKVVFYILKVLMNINLMEWLWGRKCYNWSMVNDYYEEVVCEYLNIFEFSKVFINILFFCVFLN